MEEFTLIFRVPSGKTPTEEEMKVIMEEWSQWRAAIVSEGNYVSGVQLGGGGKVLRESGVITDGPFAELKEELGGFTIIRAKDLDEATTIAHGNPVLKMGGNIEIRPAIVTKFN